MVKLEQVCFSYRQQVVLADIDLQVEPGEVLAIVGPNGSGKSTLLAVMAGLLAPQSGRIQASGAIGYIPQEAAVLEDLTVGENIRFFQSLLASPPDEPLPFGLAELWHKPVQHLSGGMKKRLSIACGLLGAPELLLWDEPSVALDMVYRQELLALIQALRQQGRCIVYVSHDFGDIIQIYDRLVLLSAGRIIFSARRDKLPADPLALEKEVGARLSYAPKYPLFNDKEESHVR